ncbi:MAG: hypothetical protein COZ70_07385 [Deltaproteobacteria bacterium CG_4_8_14_3_um_filter_51_11]|nr:MAG: hypothetical protein COX16_15595 [Deltaproteobacteria bacterium CG23_combo_of_CG06-09_8_20_14_all_51_20]PIW01491.1 MAG: hypothetical protein COW41_02450 [Deltaproteobacteria bacterium CG17_big_fil_post_rev_8_21_14_2_50_51_6]PIX19730.1 MAG: hypothetical protein COZ70_07385 [Deltaproteobacteria bacterium CG_4_8_14_3_um_filter_51_11]PIY26285.1 MAG: hypothetical protein COZ11_03005 [Deltaproteobacteria bacterium CG_4_10_14_3_um_filter_51_14]PJB33515.1 MAG: hypothetical protein CO107_15515 [
MALPISEMPGEAPKGMSRHRRLFQHPSELDHINTNQKEDTAFDFKIKLFQIVSFVDSPFGAMN